MNAARSTPKAKAQRLARYHERYYSDPQYRLRRLLRARLGVALRRYSVGKLDNTLELVGCSIAELVKHLEQQFVAGMTWENRHAWHIDHVRPIASFDLTDPDQCRACFHFSNLQPLWAADNIRKQ